MKKTMKKVLAFVLTFALLASCVINCMPAIAEGFDEAPTAYYGDNSYNAVKSDFDLYVSTSADTTHKLEKAKFEDYFYLPSDDYPYICMDKHADDFWAAWGTNAYELINNKGIYDDFELSVRINANDKDGNGGNDWAIPQVVFGKQDDTAWATAGSGFIASVLHDSSAANQKAFYSYEDGDAVYSDGGLDEAGATWGYVLTVKVVDGILTVTVSMPEWEYSASRTFDISETYEPGTIGVRFLDNAQRIRELSVKGTPIADTRAKVYDYSNLSTVDGQNAFLAGVNTYRGTSCSTTHALEAAKFSSYFKFENNKVVREGGITNFDDLWPTAGNQRTRLVFNTGKFSDFELSFSSYSGDALGYAVPTVNFGMSDAKAYANDAAGYQAYMAYWPNGGAGQVKLIDYAADGSEVILSRDTDGNNGIYGGQYGMDYKLSVKNGVATYTITHVWPDTTVSWTTSTTLPSYKDGYIAIDFIDGNSDLSNIVLKGVVTSGTYLAPEEVWELKSYNGYNSSAFESAFNLYRGNGAGKYVAADMSDYISYTDQYICLNSPVDDLNVNGDTFWGTYANTGYRLLVNNGKYKNFRLSITCNGGGTDQMKDWKSPTVIFANEYATTADSCESEYIEFNPGQTSYIHQGSNAVTTTYCGGKYTATFTLTVRNGVATYNINQFDGAVNTTLENTVAGYTGGAIGFDFPDSNFVIHNITVEGDPIEGSEIVEEDPSVIYNFSNLGTTEGQKAFKDSFYTYRGTNVLNDHYLEADNFDNYFTFDNGFLNRKGNTISNFNDLWPTHDTNRTRLAFNVGKLNNFKLTFFSYAPVSEAYGYSIPIIHFGMDKVDEFATDNTGYTAQVSYWPNTADEGRVYIEKRTAAGATELGADREVGVWDGIYGGQYGMDYSLEVKNGFVTYTVSHNWGADGTVYWTATANIEDYEAGYLAIDFIDGVCDVRNLTLKAEVVENTALEAPVVINKKAYNDFTNTDVQDAFKADFNVYSTNNATVGYHKDDFENRFSFEGNRVKYDPDVAFESFWEEYTLTKSRLIVNDGLYEDFTLQFTSVAVDGGGNGQPQSDFYMPAIIFGIDNPTKVGSEESGYGIAINFAPGESSTAYLAYYDETAGDMVSVNDSNTQNGHCGAKYDTVYTLKVEDGVATYSFSQFGGEVAYSTSFVLPESYHGGAIGIEYLPAPTYIYNVSIRGNIIPGSEINDEEETVTPGDIFGDGSVDEDDVDYILAYLLGVDDIEYVPALDVVADGVIDVRDVVYAQYLYEMSQIPV